MTYSAAPVPTVSGGAARRWRWATLLVLIAVNAGCATPSQRIDWRAAALGFEREWVFGDAYRHRLYFKPGPVGERTLHVYIEHDGSPWLGGSHVATDPTPRNPLMLELMGLDVGPAVYLGRPCYFEAAVMPPCSALTWTHRRYADEVVISMSAAIHHFLSSHPGYDSLAFFGHSGGGTLAVLLAERFPQSVAVVTLAGNLDIERWADLHRYSPLEGSLNPADRPSLRAGVLQLHYAGGRDTRVPPEIARRYAANHAGSRIIEVPDFDHACCWSQLWPAILNEVRPPESRAPGGKRPIGPPAY